MSVRDCNNRKRVVGCVNNRGILHLKPEYQELFNILYELGEWGGNGPNAGTTVTEFTLPDTSLSKITGSTSSPGFLKFTNTSSLNDPFFFADEDYVLMSQYSDLIVNIEWESDVPVELIFMAPPNGTQYYDPNYVYPTLDVESKLMVYGTSETCARTQQYDNLFVYADRPCTVKFYLSVVTPREIVYPFVPPTPETYDEYIDVQGVTTLVSQITDIGETLVHTAAPGFEEIAKYIKRTVMSYMKPNPLLERPAPDISEKLGQDFEETVVIICRNIRSYEGFADIWSMTSNMLDQMNQESKYKSPKFGIAGYASLYRSAFYKAIVQCAIVVKTRPTANRFSSMNISLRKPTGLLPDPIRDVNGVRLQVSVTPFESNGFDIFSATFALTAPKGVPPAFAVRYSYEDMKGSYGIDVDNIEIITKITFAKIGSPDVPMRTPWDPYSKVITRVSASGVIIPDYERSVYKAFVLAGGGGGGSGLDSSSGGGGGRGSYVITDNFTTSTPNNIGTYTVNPIDVVVGKGGKPARGGNDLTSVEGGQGGDSSISGNLIGTISATGGQGGTILNGGDSGGGGGVGLGPSNIEIFGVPGNAGQGDAGHPANGPAGGIGGLGPLVVFSGIIPLRSPGDPLSDVPRPGGGGAGGVFITDWIGTRGGGGNGASSPNFEVAAQAGKDGCVFVLQKYIIF